MATQKSLLGKLPASVINFLLKCDISRKSKFKLITIANRHPDFLADVSQQILTRTNFSFKIYCDRRDVIGQTIIETGQWEGLMSRTIQASLSPGDCAMDIGANMGYDSLLMSQAVGATGSVIAFEPDHNNLRRLLENTKNLQFQNVAIVSLALADIESLARIEIASIENTGRSNLRQVESNSLWRWRNIMSCTATWRDFEAKEDTRWQRRSRKTTARRRRNTATRSRTGENMIVRWSIAAT